jgi:riboflavin kinase/FMN adenylyltransferase
LIKGNFKNVFSNSHPLPQPFEGLRVWGEGSWIYKMSSKNIPLVITIGVFDGVHLGHQALVNATVTLARKCHATPGALTFQDHPLHVLRGGQRIPFLLPRNETFDLLRHEGIRWLHVVRFTRKFSKKTPEKFFQWLKAKGRLKGIVVGKDFRFGRGAKGRWGSLKALAGRYGVVVKVLEPVRADGQVVSSSRIRQLLAEGKTKLANRMLGRPYSIEGDVVHGKHVGHQIGFPTANLHCIRQFLPKDGVYACAVKINSRFYRAALNLGKRPTFKNDDHHRQAEVHLVGHHGRLYGRRMKVFLLDYLRPEKKFSSPVALVRQIKKDLGRVRKAAMNGMKSY